MIAPAGYCVGVKRKQSNVVILLSSLSGTCVAYGLATHTFARTKRLCVRACSSAKLPLVAGRHYLLVAACEEESRSSYYDKADVEVGVKQHEGVGKNR